MNERSAFPVVKLRVSFRCETGRPGTLAAGFLGRFQLHLARQLNQCIESIHI